MRTLYLHGSPDLYGAGRVLLDILQIAGNAQNAFVVLPHDGPLVGPIKALGVPVRIMNLGVLRKKYFTPQGIAGRIALWIVAVIRLRTLIKEEKIERVYINSLAVIIGPWLRTHQQTKIVWHLHEIVERPIILQNFLCWLLKKVDQRLAVSKAAQGHWQQLLGHRPVTLLYNGIDLSTTAADKPSKTPRYKQPGSSTLLIGMIGRIQERKGQSYLLRILEQLLTSTKNAETTTFKLIIAGDAYPGYEHLTQQLEMEIKERGLQDHVSYIGYQEDIAGLLSQLDLVIVPSTQPDSFPTVVLEAMKFAVPVVATRQGGCLEMIEEGVTGFFIPLDDVVSSASLLEGLLAQQQRLREAGQKGRERVSALYSKAAFQTNWLRLMQG